MTLNAVLPDTPAQLNTAFTKNPNLNGFDGHARKIIKRAIKAGWLARRSHKGHMLLYAPDGQTTTSISRDLSAPRVREAALNPIRAWERKSHLSIPKPVDDLWHCDEPGCTFKSDSHMGMVGHKGREHSLERRCMVCDRRFPNATAWAAHLRSHKDILEAPEAGAERDEQDQQTVEGVVPDMPMTKPVDVAVAEPVSAAAPAPSLAPEPEPVIVAAAEPAPEAAPPAGQGITPAETDYDLWPTDKLLERAREVPFVMDALARRFEDQNAKIELLRETLDSLM